MKYPYTKADGQDGVGREKGRVMRGRVRIVAIVAAVGLLAAACSKSTGGNGGGTGGKVVPGGTFRLGTSSTIDSLNPFVAFQANAIEIFIYTYPYLTTYDSKNNIIPLFAKSWETSSDGLTWTFHTVPNAKWSDGQPLTAEDVAWTYTTILKFQKTTTSYYSPNVVDLTSVTATDANTVAFQYSAPVGPALAELSAVPILPEHIWSRYAGGEGKGLKSYQNAPVNGQPVVSGGPFQLVNYQKDQIALLKRNDSYWGKKPIIDGFGIQIYGNEDAMVTAMKNGQLDGIEGVPTTDVKVLQDAGVKINRTAGMFFYDFIINSNPKKPAHRELLNLQVKLALEYAIDRKQIINVALGGYGTPGDSIVPAADGVWHNPNLTPIPFDLAKANEILDGLGYAKGSDGIRVANGHPMAYPIIIPTSRQAELSRTFQILQPDFQKIGVKLTLKTLDPGAAFDAIGAPNYTYLDFDLAMWDWIPAPDPAEILSVLLCNQYGSNSDSGYCNPAYDKLYHDQEAAVDQKKRLQIVYQMQQVLYDTRPYIVMNYPDVIDAYSAKWGGFYNEQGFGIYTGEGPQSFSNAHQVG
jgi:peptide/nickel transport system substrate-binding protein